MSEVLKERRGHALVLTLNRPERRNALNPALIAALTEALLAAPAEPGCRAVILTGAGTAFCAGMDLEHPAGSTHRSEAEHAEEARSLVRLFCAIRELPLPVIAAVNGAAIAGGTGLATVCDFTLAAPEAKFGYTEVRIGFVPAIVSSLLRRQTGEKAVRDLLLTGRLFTAEEALRLGLVTRVVPAAELIPAAESLAAELAANSPSSMAAVKRLLADLDGGFAEEMELSLAANAKQRQHPEFAEGVRAFLEKRRPNWT